MNNRSHCGPVALSPLLFFAIWSLVFPPYFTIQLFHHSVYKLQRESDVSANYAITIRRQFYIGSSYGLNSSRNGWHLILWWASHGWQGQTGQTWPNLALFNPVFICPDPFHHFLKKFSMLQVRDNFTTGNKNGNALQCGESPIQRDTMLMHQQTKSF